MYLKELRINGFKSFADPVKLELQPGTTAIVGPNGCGKSNIVDAIRWVLGEQKSKSLRAGSMQDVIFQGTTGRKPLNLSEVFLLFTDCEEQLGTAFTEVEVGRRVVRDGGSDYFINGKACRLKDIQKLFLDTGVGQVSYSFMLQGQIDRILSSNPSERRIIFEEAAGISRYKAQRKEALRKLSQVDANLARVTDVIEEVFRQIGSLKRQASKALRFKRIKHRLSHLELSHASWRYAQIEESLKKVEAEASTLRVKVTALRASLEGRNEKLEEAKNRQTAIGEQLQVLQQRVYESRSKRDQAQSQAEFAELRAKDLNDRIQRIQQELEALEQDKANITAQIKDSVENRQAQLDLFGDSDEAFKNKSSELVGIQERLSEAENMLQSRKQALVMAESRISRLRSNCTSLEVELKTQQSRQASLNEEVFQYREELQLMTQELEALAVAKAGRLRDRQEAEESLQAEKENLAALLSRFRSLQGDIQETDRGIATYIAKIGILEDLQNKFEGFSEGAKHVLKGDFEDLVPSEQLSILSELLEINPDYTRAVEVLLGSALDAIRVTLTSEALVLSRKLGEGQLGRACFQLPGMRVPTKPVLKTSVPEWLLQASEVIVARRDEDRDWVEGLTEGAYICPSIDDFLEFWQASPDFSFEYVVSHEGTLLDKRGFLYGGQSRGDQDSRLTRAAEIDRMTGEKNALDERLKSLRTEAHQISEKMELGEEAVSLKQSRLQEIIQEANTIDVQEKTKRQSMSHLDNRLQQREGDVEKLQAAHEDSEVRLTKAQEELEAAEGQINEAKAAILAAEDQVAQARQDREAHMDHFNSMRMEISEKKQKLQLLDQGLKALEEKNAEIHRLAQKHEGEMKSIHQQISECQLQTKRDQDIMLQMDEVLSGLQEQLAEYREAAKLAEGEVKRQEVAMSDDRDTFAESGQSLNELDISIARRQSDLEHLREEIRREYDRDVQRIGWKVELWKAGDELNDRIRVDIEEEDPHEDLLPEDAMPTDEDLAELETPNWSLVKEELESLRSRIQAMGPVNILAIDEYRALKERYDFLKAQSDDLWASKEQLVKAIDDINKTSKELFEETFKQIRKNFHYTFETLFGGGSADLELVDREDVLDSGIDITARPPGTRLKSLALLSGGQKTMTAVALLFAIYMVKPSPFCVLDEIDAPLDDVNIGRFCDMLEGFLEYSQFLIITHNKRTIAAADTIFGVTMPERGVSKLISMRFNQESNKTENLEELEEEGAGI